MNVSGLAQVNQHNGIHNLLNKRIFKEIARGTWSSMATKIKAMLLSNSDTALVNMARVDHFLAGMEVAFRGILQSVLGDELEDRDLRQPERVVEVLRLYLRYKSTGSNASYGIYHSGANESPSGRFHGVAVGESISFT